MARAAQVVDNMNLDGEWLVTCLGWAAIFNPLNDHKVILDGQGLNRAVGIEGAYFKIIKNPFGKDDNEYLLDYNVEWNDKFFHNITDLVLVQPDGTAKGKLYKAGKFKFDFTLTKVSG